MILIFLAGDHIDPFLLRMQSSRILVHGAGVLLLAAMYVAVGKRISQLNLVSDCCWGSEHLWC